MESNNKPNPLAGSPIAFGPSISPVGFPPEENHFENLAKNSKSSFNRTRNSLKLHEDMFLFGRPTKTILSIMMKLYHENIVRNLCYKEHTGQPGRFTTSPGFSDASHTFGTLRQIPEPQSFMCGLLEIDKYIYITISESPDIGGGVEDPGFDAKEATLLALLNHCNIDVEFPEEKKRNTDLSKIIGWRNFNASGPTEPILTERTKDNSLMYMNEDNTNYNSAIWNQKHTVNFINSYDYLNGRLEGISFPPFKKYKEGTRIIECINGSTCCESKLFSFVYKNLGKRFENITGLAVFWIGSELPPKHILSNYCYDDMDDPRLLDLTRFCSSVLEVAPDTIIKQMTQQLALPCPGCFANYTNYITGRMAKWDKTACYKYISPRTARAGRGGGKRATKTLKKKPKMKLVKSKELNLATTLKKIAANMNRNAENPVEYLKKSKKFFTALKTVSDDALDKGNQELYDGLINTAGYISHNIYGVFKKHDIELKNSIDALTDLFGKVGLNKDSTYRHLLDENLATNEPLVYLDHLTEEIDNMTKLYNKSILDRNEGESTKVSILMSQISEEIKKSIQQAIAHDVPKNETGLADMMNRLFIKAFK